MGGSAFNVPAERLPQEQYEAIQAYLLPRLEGMGVFEGFRLAKNLGEKKDHGDLDVLCGWSRGIVPGEEEWIPPSTANVDGIVSSTAAVMASSSPSATMRDKIVEVTETGYIRIRGGKQVTGDDMRVLQGVRDLCANVMRVTGATRWTRHGGLNSFKSTIHGVVELGAGVVSFALPTKLLGVEGRGFYQFDMILVPPPLLDFIQFINSYSSCLILGRYIHQISRSLSLHETHLALRHTAYLGLRPIEIVLTYDPKAFCQWIGLDWDKWDQGTFATERDFWAWLITPNVAEPSTPKYNDAEAQFAPPSSDTVPKPTDDSITGSSGIESPSLVARALRRLLYRKKKVYQNNEAKTARRNVPVDKFFDWLRTESVWAEAFAPTQTPHAEVSTPTGNQGAPSSTASGTEKISSNPRTAPSPFLDPAKPIPLDYQVCKALEYWGVADEYDLILEERRTMASVIAERQQERARRSEMQLAAEDTTAAALQELQTEKADQGDSQVSIGPGVPVNVDGLVKSGVEGESQPVPVFHSEEKVVLVEEQSENPEKKVGEEEKQE